MLLVMHPHEPVIAVADAMVDVMTSSLKHCPGDSLPIYRTTKREAFSCTQIACLPACDGLVLKLERLATADVDGSSAVTASLLFVFLLGEALPSGDRQVLVRSVCVVIADVCVADVAVCICLRRELR